MGAGDCPVLDLPEIAVAAVGGFLLSRFLCRRNCRLPLPAAVLLLLLLPEYEAWLFRLAAGTVTGFLLGAPSERLSPAARNWLLTGLFAALAAGLAGGRELLLAASFRWLATLAALPGILVCLARELPSAVTGRLRAGLIVLAGGGSLLFLLSGPATLYRQPGRPMLNSSGRCFLVQQNQELKVMAPNGAVLRVFPGDNFRHQELVLPALLQTPRCRQVLFLAEAPSAIPAMLAGFESVRRVDSLIAAPRIDRLLQLPKNPAVHDLPWRPYRFSLPEEMRYDLILISELPPATEEARSRLFQYLSGKLEPGGVLVMPDAGGLIRPLPCSEPLPVPGFRAWSRNAGLPGDNFDMLEKRLSELARTETRLLPQGILRELYTWRASLVERRDLADNSPPFPAPRRQSLSLRLPEFPFWGIALLLAAAYASLRAWGARYVRGERICIAAENGLSAGLFLCGGMAALSDAAFFTGDVAGILSGGAAGVLLFPAPARRKGLNLLLLGGGFLLFFLHCVRPPDGLSPVFVLSLFVLLFAAARTGRSENPEPATVLAVAAGLSGAPWLFLLLAGYTPYAIPAALAAGVLLLLPRQLKL